MSELAIRLEQGRDRLLELNSFRPEAAAPIVQEIRRQDADTTLDTFLLAVFDHYGLHVEELWPRTFRLGSAGVFADSFPGLPAEGLTVTADRQRALVREEVQFLSWDHPLVTGALDLLLGSEQGNSSVAHWPDAKVRGLYLEAVFLLECIAPPELSWKTAISSKEEPGEPLDISGTIYQADGLTPAGDFVLFVYHTDATGYYNKDDDASHPRLHGWMHVGPDGRYEFRTIKPAPYPHRTTPAHIHAHVYGPGYSERSIADYWFAGDRFITEEAREKAVHDGDDAPVVVALERDPEGVLRGVRDIRLRPTRS